MSNITLWITKKIVFILFVALLSIGTTGWVVSSYMQYTLKELNITAPSTLDIIQKSILPFSESKLTSSPAFAQEAPTLTTLGQIEEEAPPPLDTGQEKINEREVYLWKEGEVIVAQKSTDNIMSKEAIEKQNQLITAKDRMDIFSILLSKVPEDEMERMFSLLSDGLSAEEANEINNKLREYLDEKEYEFISSIIKKYEDIGGQSS